MGNYLTSPVRTDANFNSFGTATFNPPNDPVLFPDTYGDAQAIAGPLGSGNSLRMRGGFQVTFVKFLDIPAAYRPGDDLVLLMDLQVTNPGEHFGEGNTPAQPVSDPSSLCRLLVGRADTGGPPLIDQLMQPNDDIPSLNPFEVLVEDPTAESDLINFAITMTCPETAELLADFQIDEMALVVTRRVSTTTTSTTSTSTSSSESTTTTTTTTTSSSTEATTSTTTTTDFLTTTSSTTSTSVSTTSAALYTHRPHTPGSFIGLGCFGSRSGFPTFELRQTSSVMTAELCVDACSADNRVIAGLFGESCYCGNTVHHGDYYPADDGQCDITCPGDPTERCGGRGPGSRDLWERSHSGSVPPYAFLTIYTTLTGEGGRPMLPAPTRTGPAPYPTTDGKHPGWWACRFGACSFDVIILKPWSCDSGCDDGLYYELVCDGCRPGEEHWKPTRCSGGSCRGKEICKPEKCSGGHCGEYPIVEKEECDTCEGGISYRPRPHDEEKGPKDGGRGGGHDGGRGKDYEADKGHREGDETSKKADEGSKKAEETSKKTDETSKGDDTSRKADEGSTKADESEVSRHDPHGQDVVTENGFVVASSTSNLSSLSMIVVGLISFRLLAYFV